MPSGSHPYRNRGSDRLRTAAATAVAVLAVLAGILLVNLFNGDTDDEVAAAGASPTRAASAEPTRPAETTEPTRPAESTRPAETTEPTPSRQATPTTAPATPKPGSDPAAPHVVAPVIVLNNSRIAKLADRAADKVEAAGFKVERTGNYVGQYNVPVTTVFYDPEDAEAARTLLETVPGVDRMVPRAETRIVETDTLILVITRDFPAGDQP
ncbi:LytR cell envelope-related transcriptional attenuator [Parafrankia irregularis]|uniref:LytR cell envelope-related transcriptional attenuator n=1 Tax=Parafrankia irregularis TaxID=795642 RepID=A0A0S4QQ53_9ACTN|nr:MULTISPECIES: LytR C-terminal domain-containing protein [Parafrankia]MBE3204459.1 LytR C-terminal domain-containing protein [Parafrankia sp. CH37]CUU57733.1 LytR cell envelope-related transcriptional attenuator [Parafrankia irregularis]